MFWVAEPETPRPLKRPPTMWLGWVLEFGNSSPGGASLRLLRRGTSRHDTLLSVEK